MPAYKITHNIIHMYVEYKCPVLVKIENDKQNADGIGHN